VMVVSCNENCPHVAQVLHLGCSCGQKTRDGTTSHKLREYYSAPHFKGETSLTSSECVTTRNFGLSREARTRTNEPFSSCDLRILESSLYNQVYFRIRQEGHQDNGEGSSPLERLQGSYYCERFSTFFLEVYAVENARESEPSKSILNTHSYAASRSFKCPSCSREHRVLISIPRVRVNKCNDAVSFAEYLIVVDNGIFSFGSWRRYTYFYRFFAEVPFYSSSFFASFT